ncbi:hypothetical protein CR513_15394, partial [Mucuna pruriens]
MRRSVSSHISDQVETQRENIFHSRCLVLDNLCYMMIDDKQLEVTFTLSSYEDKVICDVVSMEATHLLLGTPWKFDRKVIHDGVTNRFTFVHLGQRIMLKPLIPREVNGDQNKMKTKRELERKAKSKIEKEVRKKGEMTTVLIVHMYRSTEGLQWALSNIIFPLLMDQEMLKPTKTVK